VITLDSKEVKKLKVHITFRDDPEGLEIQRMKNWKISSDSMFLLVIGLFTFFGLVLLTIYFGVLIEGGLEGWTWLGLAILTLMLGCGGLACLIFTGIFIWKFFRILRKWAVVNITPEQIRFLRKDGQIGYEFPFTEIEKVYLFRYQITRQGKYATYLLGYTLNMKIVLCSGQIIYSGDILSTKKSPALYQVMKHIRNGLEKGDIINVEHYFKNERKIVTPRFWKFKMHTDRG